MMPKVSFSATRNPTILIVDDEVLIRSALSDYLQECGFKALEASSAEECIAILENAKFTIHLIFSDVRMPGAMDGFGLAKWVRANRREIPIILRSSDARKATLAKELCEEEPFFSNPYDVRAAVAQIRAAINARKEP